MEIGNYCCFLGHIAKTRKMCLKSGKKMFSFRLDGNGDRMWVIVNKKFEKIMSKKDIVSACGFLQTRFSQQAVQNDYSIVLIADKINFMAGGETE